MENPLVSLQNVTAYQRKKAVLIDVTLDVNKGEFVYIIGKTGSGKSSLLKVLYKEVNIDQGEGKVLDYNLNKIKSREIPKLRRKLGIVFQDFQLLSDRNIEDNLLFVMKATDWKDTKNMHNHLDLVLRQVNLEGINKKFPHQLSGGEQQRVVIARAMINSPQLILADEPTGNLDPNTSNEIMELLKSIANSGTAVIMATHDMGIVNDFPGRILVCENGKIAESKVE
jgi:cell division transport system ATP-binding protein